MDVLFRNNSPASPPRCILQPTQGYVQDAATSNSSLLHSSLFPTLHPWTSSSFVRIPAHAVFEPTLRGAPFGTYVCGHAFSVLSECHYASSRCVLTSKLGPRFSDRVRKLLNKNKVSIPGNLQLKECTQMPLRLCGAALERK